MICYLSKFSEPIDELGKMWNWFVQNRLPLILIEEEDEVLDMMEDYDLRDILSKFD